MLPVIPAAGNVERSSKKVRKRKNKHDPDTRIYELSITRHPSTNKTESTLIESSEEYWVKEPANVAHHQRDLSLIVDFDLERAAKHLKDGEISDLDLALFVFWVKAKNENYMMAKELVRELALDQVKPFHLRIVDFATDHCRDTMSTRSPIRVCANCSRKYTIFVQGVCPEKIFHQCWQQQMAHVTADQSASSTF